MSIIVRIIGEKDTSDEYLAAEKLKTIIDTTAPSDIIGEIILYPSATLFGMTVKDVDIMMMGELHNYRDTFRYYNGELPNKPFEEDIIRIKNFCTTIEIKSHTVSGIKMQGTNFLVKYPEGFHNATNQSNAQKTSARKFFMHSLGVSPFVTNLLWFTEVSPNELQHLLNVNGNTLNTNALPSSFNFRTLIQNLIFQKTITNSTFICETNGKTPNDYIIPFRFFSKAKEGMGELTRKKIEMITQTALSATNSTPFNEQMTILRGKAGTGKTIELIRAAIKLVDEQDARVQILTYNRALVADIRRLFALADFPDMFEMKCVSINTMQSYYYGLINGCLYDGNLSGEDFLNRYDELLSEMISFLKKDSSARELIQLICEDNPRLNWEYILVDEAQDWSSKERDLLLLLFDKAHILVADGGQQFVRSIDPCDWSIIRDRNIIKLKQCLRQKNNIVKFVNHYALEIDSSFNRISTSDSMVGGKIIILKDQNKFYDIVKTELKEIKKSGNISYDMLFLTPSTLVAHNGSKSFTKKKEFEHRNILLWDGTDDNNRLDYAIDPDESRVLQYESSRGLEGWTVCCLDFDDFLNIKEQQYDPSLEGNALLLESAEDRKKRYMLNWALIPMTRAIDTLIITLKDEHSPYSKSLLAIAQKYPDYVHVI